MPTKKASDPSTAKLQARTAEILARAVEFCRLHLDGEYERLCEKVIGKLSRKRPSPLVTGRTDIWAGGVIYALGQINFLFDRSQKPHVKEADIAEYFGTSTATLGQKSKLIRDMFKMRRWEPEFSTRKMAARNPFAKLVAIDGVIVPLSLLGELGARRPGKG